MTTPLDVVPVTAIRQHMTELLDQVSDRMGYLYGRWLDEQEYEDIADYADAIRKVLPDGVGLVRMFKRPFGFTMTTTKLPGRVFRISCSITTIKWSMLP